MRIIQLIDSLEAGGAERMAVSYANALSKKVDFSGIIASRKQGALKDQIKQLENYLFLNKKHNLDLKAFLKFRRFIIKNRITYIHAHGSSYFWTTLLKISYPKVKIIWHDHFGNRVHQANNSSRILKLCSKMFYGIITVNTELKNWASSNLKCNRVIYLPNFMAEIDSKIEQKTKLKGIEGKRIVFLANLKNPKNHLSFLKAFKVVQSNFTEWTLHLIGKDYQDKYSKELKEYILQHNLKESVYIYDSRTDIVNILQQSNIGVLASTYEGFPVTLLEYGKANLLVISTNVGYCPEIIKDNKNGFLFNPLQMQELIVKLQNAMEGLENKKEKFLKLGNQLNQSINDNFAENSVIEKYIDFIKN